MLEELVRASVTQYSEAEMQSPAYEEAMRLRALFARATGHFASDIRHYTSILCKEIREDGVILDGQTGFFRHARVLESLVKSLQQENPAPQKPRRILAAPASIGCEAYSLSALAVDKGLGGTAGFMVDAFDMSAMFTSLARVQRYPVEIVRRLGESWREILFADDREQFGLVPVLDAVKNHVRFLEPQAFESFAPQEKYDAVIVNNLFKYMNGTQIDATFQVIEECAPSLVIFNQNAQRHYRDPQGSYVDIRDHSFWGRTSLGREDVHGQYAIWARMQQP